MRRDWTGEPVDEDVSDEHVCRRGWLDRGGEQPQACRVCRPWLFAHPARPPTAAELTAFRARHPETA